MHGSGPVAPDPSSTADGPGSLLIRGATILTMDSQIGDFPKGDLLVRDGTIVAVSPALEGPGGTEILDARGMIALPGFIDTHWHLWNTILRGVSADAGMGYMAHKARLGPHFRPEETYASVRLALTEAVNGGVTTIHDWSHNVMRPEDADADVQALLDAGIRARFSYGAPSTAQGLTLEQMAAVMAPIFPLDRAMDLDDAVRIRSQVTSNGTDPLISVGVTLRGPARSTPAVYRGEWAEARSRDLPIAMHCAGTAREVGIIQQASILDGDGLLGPDVLLAHGNYLSDEEVEALARHGVSLSISPFGELRSGARMVRIGEVRQAGVRVGLSFDTTSSTSADMFALMRLTVDVENSRLEDPDGLRPADVLAMATSEGARILGLGDVTGSLTPGKRADIQLIRADALNLAPLGDPATALVHGGQPGNVDTVLVDGRFLKRGGALIGTDVDAIVAEAGAALARIEARAG